MTTQTNEKLLERIQASSRNVRGEAGTGYDTLLFLNTRYETFPVVLQQDSLISANAKNVYNNLWIWAKSSKQTNSLNASLFPGYDYIMRATGLSRGTVSSSLTQLRLQRYLTLHQKIRTDQGMFVGNDYILNDEPLGFSDTLALDNDFLKFAIECQSYRHHRVQQLAVLVSKSIQLHIEAEDNPFRPTTHLEKIEARQQAAQIIQARLFPEDIISGHEPEHFFGIPVDDYHAMLNQVHKVNADENDENHQVHKVNAVVNADEKQKTSQVHKVNADETLTDVQVHKVNAVVNVEVNGCSSSYLNNTTTTVVPEFTELVYPAFETPNELYICKLLMAKVDPQYQQAILDELAARMSSTSKHHQKLDNPIGYLKGWLIKKLNEGEIPLTSLGAKLAAERVKPRNASMQDTKQIQQLVFDLKQDIRHFEMMIDYQLKQGQDAYELITQRDSKQAQLDELETRRVG